MSSFGISTFNDDGCKTSAINFGGGGYLLPVGTQCMLNVSACAIAAYLFVLVLGEDELQILSIRSVPTANRGHGLRVVAM